MANRAGGMQGSKRRQCNENDWRWIQTNILIANLNLITWDAHNNAASATHRPPVGISLCTTAIADSGLFLGPSQRALMSWMAHWVAMRTMLYCLIQIALIVAALFFRALIYLMLCPFSEQLLLAVFASFCSSWLHDETVQAKWPVSFSTGHWIH